MKYTHTLTTSVVIITLIVSAGSVGASTVIFSDDFEGVPASPNFYTPGSGDFDPVADVGTWTQILEHGDERVQVTDNSSPGPSSGSTQYLGMMRLSGAKPDLRGQVASTASQATERTVNLSLAVRVTGSASAVNGPVVKLFNDTDSGEDNLALGIWFGFQGVDGSVVSYRGASAWETTGLPFSRDTWTPVVISADLDTQTYDLTVGSNTTTLPFMSTQSTIQQIAIQGAHDDWPMYLDDINMVTVPEPATGVLLLAGLGYLTRVCQRRK